MKKSELAQLIFSQHNCAQTIFSLFAAELGLDEKTALKIASGFGGGMNNGETCGAVTGAYMVIGLKSGHITANPDEKQKTSELIRKFNTLFLSEHPSLKCSELLGFDVTDPVQKQHARDAGVYSSLCPRFIKTATEILEKDF